MQDTATTAAVVAVSCIRERNYSVDESLPLETDLYSDGDIP